MNQRVTHLRFSIQNPPRGYEQQVQFMKQDPLLSTIIKQRQRLPSTISPQVNQTLASSKVYFNSHRVKSVVKSVHSIENYYFTAAKTQILRHQNQECIDQMEQLQKLACDDTQILSIPRILIKENQNRRKYQKTICLDLDETLVHCEPLQINEKYNHVCQLDHCIYGINLRPHLTVFLKQLSELCEVVIYTAATLQYANKILHFVDPQKLYISHVISRAHCIPLPKSQVMKNVLMINRPASSIVLVDNSPICAVPCKDNYIPILPYFDDSNDRELLSLFTFLRDTVLPCDNVQEELSKFLNLSQFKNNNKISEIVSKF